MIAIHNLTFEYTHARPVFRDFHWEVQRGETWAILGPSGCGKTTLLYLLAGLRQVNTGTIRIDGDVLRRPRPQTGLIIQDYGLLPWATVRENAWLGWRVRNLYGPDGTHAPRESVPVKVDAWLERLGLMDVAGQYPGQISGGQRQRTAIARTLSLQPDLLLMDEPFSSLDAPTREGLQNLTLELRAENNLTLVLVTHSIEEALTLGEKILLLGNIPNTTARIIDNPGFKLPNHRATPEFLDLCFHMRELMGDHIETT